MSDNMNFLVDAGNITIEKGGSRQLTFSHISGQGYTVRKIYTFTSGEYAIKFETLVINNSAAPMVGAVYHVMTYPAEPKVKDNRFETAGAYLFSDNTLQINKISDVSSASKRFDKGIQWSVLPTSIF